MSRRRADGRARRARRAAAFAGALAISACSGSDDAAVDDTTVSVPVTDEASGDVFAEGGADDETPATEPASSEAADADAPVTVDEPRPDRQPLTGEPLADPGDLVDRPALAVVIDNAPQARPAQSGLAVADLVVETVVEAGLTRLTAVFHTADADPVGPIRSTRTQDVALLSGLNAPLVAAAGANPATADLVGAALLTDVNWADHPDSYARVGDNPPHDLFSSTDTLRELTPDDHPGPPAQQFFYVGPNQEPAGREVVSFGLTMGQLPIEWRWDEAQRAWSRLQDQDVHVDATYGPITAQNVVVLVAEYRPSPADERSPEAQTVGRGLAYVFTDGDLLEGFWWRDLAVGRFRLTDVAGEPIPIVPGRTWIEVAALDDDATDGESPVDLAIVFADELPT